MMNSYIANPLEFIITTLFSLYILAVMLRFLLGVVRADFYNPISQFLVRITNPLLIPLRKILPGFGKVDVAAIVLMLLLSVAMLFVIVLLRGAGVSILPLLLMAVGRLVMLALNVFLVAIIVQVIISWINPGSYNPVNALLDSLTAPILRPIQRIIPPLSGIDLSPLFALIGLQVLKMLIQPLLV
ncbi:MAG: YggT family protein [Gammaproteobacteria bacterium]|nr:YggT family protein [Gammaproteobacteria bacterium]NNJ93838.1 YggT family protein [Halobacteria archaeon]